MAKGQNILDNKHSAKRALDEARQQIDVELAYTRHQLSPSRITHDLMNRHLGTVLGITLVLGLGAGLLFYRKPSPPPKHIPPPPKEKQKASSGHIAGSFLGGIVGHLAKLSAPFIAKVLFDRGIAAWNTYAQNSLPRGEKASFGNSNPH